MQEFVDKTTQIGYPLDEHSKDADDDSVLFEGIHNIG